jgi:hypothetical protein
MAIARGHSTCVVCKLVHESVPGLMGMLLQLGLSSGGSRGL